MCLCNPRQVSPQVPPPLPAALPAGPPSPSRAGSALRVHDDGGGGARRRRVENGGFRGAAGEEEGGREVAAGARYRCWGTRAIAGVRGREGRSEVAPTSRGSVGSSRGDPPCQCPVPRPHRVGCAAAVAGGVLPAPPGILKPSRRC